MRPLVLLAALAWSVPALAHIDLITPEARYDDNEQKRGPCGRAGGERTTNVSAFEPGATIEVVWEETVPHPGYYRIAFDEDGDDNFGDPIAPGEGNPADVWVLLDEISDQAADPYRVEVTLPDLECTNCTLQLIQVMTDKPPYGDGNDIYYACADLELQYGAGTPEPGDTDTTPPTGTDPGPTDTDAPDSEPLDSAAPVVEEEKKGCNSSGAPFGWAALGLALLAIRRR